MISFICNHIVVTIYQDQLVYQYASTLHPLALAFSSARREKVGL